MQVIDPRAGAHVKRSRGLAEDRRSREIPERRLMALPVGGKD
jgi:hypothetical protein